MSNKSTETKAGPEAAFSREVGLKAARKMKARRHAPKGFWFGFSMFGIVGWSVSVPTLLGALVGAWLDKRFPGAHSRTLALLVAGLVLGCWMAWHWISMEYKDIQKDEDSADE